MLILVVGLPGSGKTYFARAVSQKLGATHINSDKIRKELFKMPQYKAADKSAVYDVMYRRVCQTLEQGQTVILDATFSLQKYRIPYLNYAKKNKIPLRIILIRADEKVILQRLQTPRPDSDADFAVYSKIKSEFEPLAMPHLELTSTQLPLDDLIELCLDYLKQEES